MLLDTKLGKIMAQEIITFGCRLNAYESEVIKNNLEKSGLDNVAVFNTCAVTKEAERQAKQSIRRYRRENPDHKIIVTGCAAQINPKKYADMPEVDQVIGNEEKLRVETFELKNWRTEELGARTEVRASLEQAERRSMEKLENFSENIIDNTQKILVNDIMSVKETASHLVSSLEGKSRAFVQVQNGCNHRCTFCIIPYGRGNSRSVPVGEIVTQVRKLAESGYKEIVLTGVDISDYGLDLPGRPRLGQMIKRLLALVPEVKRVRLSSIDVAEIDEDLLNLIASEPRLMPHLHLSLQAGDNMILKRMKRRHLREDIIEFCKKARLLRPDIVFGADIIAGFPTETDEMFQNTLNIVEEAGLTYLHVFPYSEREGTPAAKMPQLSKAVRKKRADMLRKAGEKAVENFLKTRIGKTENIIVENGEIGRSEHFAPVQLSEKIPAGSLITAKIKSANASFLLAA